MRNIFIFCFVLFLASGCKKDGKSTGEGPKVEIYMLSSFSININQSTSPATVVISNAVLADQPLVADEDIEYYRRSTTSFKLRKDIKAIIKNYGPDKAFAVTINKQPVYYGKFHPLYLSSLTIGVATIDPLFLKDNELTIGFTQISGSSVLQQLDKRNDAQLIDALRRTNRIR